MVSAIGVTSLLSNVKIPSFKGRNNVSFGADVGDSFVASTRVVDGNISQEAAEHLLSAAQSNENIVGCGYTAHVHKIGDIALKVPRTDHSEQMWTEIGNMKIFKEYAALKEINKIAPDVAVQSEGLIQKGKFYHLAEKFISGFHPFDSDLPKENLHDLVSKLTTLDKNGIFNSDLQSANIFFLRDGTSRLIDFGSYSVLSDFGQMISSDCLTPDLLMDGNGKASFSRFINFDNSRRYAASFFTKNALDVACDLKNYADNPYLSVKSNVSNFEFRNMFTYLREGFCSDRMQALKDYVTAKGQVYHKGMAEFLKTVDVRDKAVLQITDMGSAERITEAAETLKKAVHFEELASEVLSSPTEEVLKAEAAKIQLKMFLNSDSWHSSIPHEQGLRSAYNQTVRILQENIENSHGNTREYFRETLKGIQTRFKDIQFVPDQVEIPDSENLMKIMFPSHEPAGRSIAQRASGAINDVSRRNRTIGICVAAGAAAVAFAGIYLHHKHKAKAQNEVKEQNNQAKEQNLPKVNQKQEEAKTKVSTDKNISSKTSTSNIGKIVETPSIFSTFA